MSNNSVRCLSPLLIAAVTIGWPLRAQPGQPLAAAQHLIEEGDYQSAQEQLDLAAAKALAVNAQEEFQRIAWSSAENLIVLGRYRDAAAELQRLTSPAPVLQARYLAGAGRYREALEWLRKDDPAELRTEILLDAGELDLAAGVLERAPGLDPARAEWLRGEWAFLAGRLDLARERLDACRRTAPARKLVQNPLLAAVNFRLAELALDRGSFEEAEDFRKVALSFGSTIGPLAARSAFLRGRIQLAAGQPDRAVSSFRAAMQGLRLDVGEASPVSMVVESWLLYAAKGDGSPAAPALVALEKQISGVLGAGHPEDATIALLAAEALLDEGRASESSALIDTVLAATGSRYPALPLVAARVQASWGKRMIERERYSAAIPYLRQAEEAYRKAGATMPAAELRLSLARAMSATGDYHGVEALLGDIVNGGVFQDDAGREALAMLLLGEANAFEQRCEQAEPLLERARSATLGPDLRQQAERALAGCAFTRGDLTQALRLYTSALRKPAPEATSALGWCRAGHIHFAAARYADAAAAYSVCWEFYGRGSADPSAVYGFLMEYVQTLVQAGRLPEVPRWMEQWLRLAGERHDAPGPVDLAAIERILTSLEGLQDAKALEAILRGVLELTNPASSGAAGADWLLDRLGATNRQLNRFADAASYYERLADRQGRRRLLELEAATIEKAWDCRMQSAGADAPETIAVLLRRVSNRLDAAGLLSRKDAGAAVKMADATEVDLARARQWETAHSAPPPLRAGRIYLEAKRALLDGRPEATLEWIGQIRPLLTDPNVKAAGIDRRVALLGGRALLQQMNFSAALESLALALADADSPAESGFLSAEEVNDIAYAFERAGRAAEAEPYFLRHRELCRTVFGAASEEEAYSLEYYADYLDRRQRRAEALDFAEQAQKLFSPASRENAVALQQLAFLYAKNAEPLRGAECLRESAELLRALGELEGSRDYLLRETARLLQEGGRAAESAEVYGELLESAREHNDPAAILFAWKNQTLCLEEAGRHDQAKALAEQFRKYARSLPKPQAVAAETDYFCSWAGVLEKRHMAGEAAAVVKWSGPCRAQLPGAR
jgi:hypothetical protein